MIAEINRIFVRRYSDNRQVTAYVEWTDGKGRKGRTEGPPSNSHMQALFARGIRAGLIVVRETW